MRTTVHHLGRWFKQKVKGNSILYDSSYRAKEMVEEVIKKSGLPSTMYKLTHRSQEEFTCPICHYNGPFRAATSETLPPRKHAQCPGCGALERHRLQFVVMKSLAQLYDFSSMSMLHFAPEAHLKRSFCKWFGTYKTADLSTPSDFNVNLTDLPFSDSSYDCVFASHVLEHIREDRKALAEISRILRPSGFAVLPVPIVAYSTVEYPEPNPYEHHHVRAPGFDYFERYKPYFDSVEEYRSEHFPSEHQVWIYQDRSIQPKHSPLRPTMQGERFSDIVPVCYIKPAYPR